MLLISVPIVRALDLSGSVKQGAGVRYGPQRVELLIRYAEILYKIKLRFVIKTKRLDNHIKRSGMNSLKRFVIHPGVIERLNHGVGLAHMIDPCFVESRLKGQVIPELVAGALGVISLVGVADHGEKPPVLNRVAYDVEIIFNHLPVIEPGELLLGRVIGGEIAVRGF